MCNIWKYIYIRKIYSILVLQPDDNAVQLSSHWLQLGNTLAHQNPLVWKTVVSFWVSQQLLPMKDHIKTGSRCVGWTQKSNHLLNTILKRVNCVQFRSIAVPDEYRNSLQNLERKLSHFDDAFWKLIRKWMPEFLRAIFLVKYYSNGSLRVYVSTIQHIRFSLSSLFFFRPRTSLTITRWEK